jgi:hypothetical protein
MWLPSFGGPAERSWRRESENAEFENLRDQLQAIYSPPILYRALLYWYRSHNKKDGNAYHAFKDLFGGGKPTTTDQCGDPVCLNDPDFERWVQLRTERNKRAWQRLKAKERRK